MSQPLMTVEIKYEPDVVTARQRARQIAQLVGFENQEQVRIATAVSELARNVFQYAGRGKVQFLLEGKTSPQLFLVRITDAGKGISNLPVIMSGQYKSQTGMGLGILGAKRMVDQF